MLGNCMLAPSDGESAETAAGRASIGATAGAAALPVPEADGATLGRVASARGGPRRGERWGAAAAAVSVSVSTDQSTDRDAARDTG